MSGSGIGPAGVMVMPGIADDARVRDLTARATRADHRRDRRDERAITHPRGRVIFAVQMTFRVGGQDSTGTNRSRRAWKGKPTGYVVAHRLGHRVLAVDAHDDVLRGGVGMHLDAVTHIHRPSPSVRGPVITAGQRFTLPDRSPVGRIAVTPRACIGGPVP